MGVYVMSAGTNPGPPETMVMSFRLDILSQKHMWFARDPVLWSTRASVPIGTIALITVCRVRVRA